MSVDAANTEPSSSSGDRAHILTINAGSSSIKFSVFKADGKTLVRTVQGSLQWLRFPDITLQIHDTKKSTSKKHCLKAEDRTEVVNVLMDWIRDQHLLNAFTAVGHRIVHGGPHYFQPQLLTPDIIEELAKLSALDPEHLPQEIELLRAVQRRFNDLPQVVCFDTAFHHELPRAAQIIAIPRRYEQQGLRRYGFHGLSYAWLLEELARLDGVTASLGRVIFAHLGNGVSLAAVHKGKPVDTTMGFSPSSGLPMGTRAGDLDPGVMTWLIQSQGMSAEQFNQMINSRSGLLGISETSSDMRELLASEEMDVRAAEAVELFCYQIRKCIGAYAAALGGVDTLVFAGGIGENSSQVRARICSGLEFLGIRIDAAQNSANAQVLSVPDGKVKIRCIPTDEEQMIARSVCRVLDLN